MAKKPKVVRANHDFADQALFSCRDLSLMKRPSIPIEVSPRTWRYYMTRGRKVRDVNIVLPSVPMGSKLLTSKSAITQWINDLHRAGGDPISPNQNMPGLKGKRKG